MYSPSPRFSLAYAYAKKVADMVYIISVKYELFPEEQVIEAYNGSLIGKSVFLKSYANLNNYMVHYIIYSITMHL